MSVIAVIPARYGSTRFPGKPLAPIAGKMMIERVWQIAAAAEGVDRVVVATDDERIRDAVEQTGGEAIMTDESCRNGTERVLDAVKRLNSDADIIINVQGDAPLIPPWVIGGVAETLRENPICRWPHPPWNCQPRRKTGCGRTRQPVRPAVRPWSSTRPWTPCISQRMSFPSGARPGPARRFTSISAFMDIDATRWNAGGTGTDTV